MTQSQTQIERADDVEPVMPPARDAPVRSLIARKLWQGAVRMVPVRVLWPNGSMTGCGDEHSPVFESVNPPQYFARLGRDFKIGFGEAYMAGDWRPAAGHDLADVLAPFAARMTRLVPQPLQKFRSLADLRAPKLRHNTLDGSKANIEAHYDLSNDLFQRFLDDLQLSSFDGEEPFDGDLEEAQHRKIDSILDMAGVVEGSHVLEIGSGWGHLSCAPLSGVPASRASPGRRSSGRSLRRRSIAPVWPIGSIFGSATTARCGASSIPS